MNEAMDISSIKVSAIIITYNRYHALMNAIESVKRQTHRNIEIIVVNDKSDSEEYYSKAHNDVKWIDLERSSREACGFPSCGYVRNMGIAEAQGDYVAFLDDDDLWMPEKIRTQLSAMVKEGWVMSCTEGYMGDSFYDEKKKYPIYHAEHYEKYCERFFKENYGRWDGRLPDVFDLKLIQKHNFVIASSVMLKKSVLYKVGLFKEVLIGVEDKDLWRRVLEHYNCLHINQPLVYYDGRLSYYRFHRRVFRKIGKIVSNLTNHFSPRMYRGRKYPDL